MFGCGDVRIRVNGTPRQFNFFPTSLHPHIRTSPHPTMRIAVSGAHGTGKSTLVSELARCLPHYQVVEEPYYTLLSQGHAFSDPPSIEDVELHCELALSQLAATAAPHVLFDRCPIDFLAYLAALRDPPAVPLSVWVERTVAALPSLDLVIFVPIERPDRVLGTERPQLRARVHTLLEQILLEDSWGLGAPVLAVAGPVETRVAQVLERLGR